MFTRPVQINVQVYAMMEAHILQHIAIMAAEQVEPFCTRAQGKATAIPHLIAGAPCVEARVHLCMEAAARMR